MAPIKILLRPENTQPSRGMLRCSHLINYLIIWNTVFQIVMSQSRTDRNCFMGLRKPPGAGSVASLLPPLLSPAVKMTRKKQIIWPTLRHQPDQTITYSHKF